MGSTERLEALRRFVTRLCQDRSLTGLDVADVKARKVDYPFEQGGTGVEVSFKVSNHFLGKSTSSDAAMEELLRALSEEDG